MIHYKRASQKYELEQILQLQRDNLPTVISEETKKMEGFVTVHHDFNILNRMNEACPHVIATHEDKVVGYTLCMHPKFGDEIEVLQPMFAETNRILGFSEKYIAMGQVCVDKDYRRQGIFRKLYRYMLQEIKPEFDCIITEVDIENTRSLEAHYAVGFELLSRYRSDGHDWELIRLR
ncbi:MAG: GNAT family N-acetyltransferase [Bacteroidota bacterium]